MSWKKKKKKKERERERKDKGFCRSRANVPKKKCKRILWHKHKTQKFRKET